MTVRTALKPEYVESTTRQGIDMTSRLDRLTAAAEIVSAVAVVISLVVLIFSVRENTAVLRATAAADSRDSLASMNDLDLTLGREHLELITRSSSPHASPDDFTELELAYLRFAQRSFFRRAEAQYFRYRSGLLDDDAWQTVRRRVWLNIQSPIESYLWKKDRAEVYTPGFVAAVESYGQHPDRSVGR